MYSNWFRKAASDLFASSLTVITIVAHIVWTLWHQGTRVIWTMSCLAVYSPCIVLPMLQLNGGSLKLSGLCNPLPRLLQMTTSESLIGIVGHWQLHHLLVSAQMVHYPSLKQTFVTGWLCAYPCFEASRVLLRAAAVVFIITPSLHGCFSLAQSSTNSFLHTDLSIQNGLTFLRDLGIRYYARSTLQSGFGFW